MRNTLLRSSSYINFSCFLSRDVHKNCDLKRLFLEKSDFKSVWGNTVDYKILELLGHEGPK